MKEYITRFARVFIHSSDIKKMMAFELNRKRVQVQKPGRNLGTSKFSRMQFSHQNLPKFIILPKNENWGLGQVVMGPGQKILTRVGSIFCGTGRVSHLWFGFEFGKFPLKMSNFFLSGQKNLFGSGQKVPRSKVGWPLIYCRSKVSSGRVGSGPI